MTPELATVRVIRAQKPLAGQGQSEARTEPEFTARQEPGRPRSIYIAWVNYQRRAESMQSYFGYDLFYVSSQHRAPFYKFISYFLRAKMTMQIVLREKPDVVWVQLPPTFLMHLLILLRFVIRRKMKIVADCHNAALRPPWNSVPLCVRFLNRASLIVVHNDNVVETAHSLGLNDKRLCVLGDCVPILPSAEIEARGQPRPTIVMPCSFHADEPIEAVLEAAREFESATFVITGDHLRIRNRALVEQVTENVRFPGFLPLPEFDRLLLRASAVLCLTTQDDIQLSAISEAIAAGKPMIISDTSLLRNLFGTAGIFVDNSVASILQGCRTALERNGEYAAATRTMRARRMQRWLGEAEPVRARLTSDQFVSA
jgi:glycosyltransferase involved in cell wall biosynthesis